MEAKFSSEMGISFFIDTSTAMRGYEIVLKKPVFVSSHPLSPKNGYGLFVFNVFYFLSVARIHTMVRMHIVARII